MNKLKFLLLYRERHYENRDPLLPSLDNNKGIISESLANKIVSYLEGGTTLFEFVSPTTDPYNEKDFIPYKIVSDGVYVWDGVIINWVKKYRIRLPEDFLTHLEKVSYTPTEMEQVALIEKYKEGIDEVYCIAPTVPPHHGQPS